MLNQPLGLVHCGVINMINILMFISCLGLKIKSHDPPTKPSQSYSTHRCSFDGRANWSRVELFAHDCNAIKMLAQINWADGESNMRNLYKNKEKTCHWKNHIIFRNKNCKNLKLITIFSKY